MTTTNELYNEISKALRKHIPNDKIIELIQQVKDEWEIAAINRYKYLKDSD
jgi:hypothetical protein